MGKLVTGDDDTLLRRMLDEALTALESIRGAHIATTIDVIEVMGRAVEAVADATVTELEKQGQPFERSRLRDIASQAVADVLDHNAKQGIVDVQFLGPAPRGRLIRPFDGSVGYVTPTLVRFGFKALDPLPGMERSTSGRDEVAEPETVAGASDPPMKGALLAWRRGSPVPWRGELVSLPWSAQVVLERLIEQTRETPRDPSVSGLALQQRLDEVRERERPARFQARVSAVISDLRRRLSGIEISCATRAVDSRHRQSSYAIRTTIAGRRAKRPGARSR